VVAIESVQLEGEWTSWQSMSEQEASLEIVKASPAPA